MIKRKKRAIGIISLMLVASISIYAILWALKDNIVFFYSPSEINQKILSDSLEEKSFIRLGGMVKESSIVKLNNGSITFVVTDFNKEIKKLLCIQTSDYSAERNIVCNHKCI